VIKVLSIGEVMLEMSDIGGGNYKKSYAGDTFNVAHYLHTVSRGQIQPEYLTALGADAESSNCLSFLREKGVGISKCVQDPDRTIGLFILSNDENGEKQYAYWRGQSAARHLFDSKQDLAGFDIVYFSGITAAITENRENLVQSIKAAGQKDARIVYDFNHRVMLWTPDDARSFAQSLLPQVDLVKISDEELDFLYPGKTLAEFSSLYPDAEWVFTCGGKKGEVWKNGRLTAQQIFKAEKNVVDSSAAGDAFIATYLEAKISGLEPLAAIQRGHYIASQVVCKKGSVVPLVLTGLKET